MKTLRAEKLQIQDTMKELGNIGIGAAATSLSTLTHMSVKAVTTSLSPIDHEQLFNQTLMEDQVIGILFPYDKDIQGYGLFILEEGFVNHIVREFYDGHVEFHNLEKESIAILQEICSIMISSYLACISSATDINIRIQLPAISKDMKGSIINDGLTFILRQGKEAIWLEHELKLEDFPFVSHLIFMMTIDSIDTVIRKLEVKL